MGLHKAAPHTFKVFGKDITQSALPHQAFAIVFMKSCMPVTDDYQMSCLLYTQGHMTLYMYDDVDQHTRDLIVMNYVDICCHVRP